jgi:hypothetical protein
LLDRKAASLVPGMSSQLTKRPRWRRDTLKRPDEDNDGKEKQEIRLQKELNRLQTEADWLRADEDVEEEESKEEDEEEDEEESKEEDEVEAKMTQTQKVLAWKKPKPMTQRQKPITNKPSKKA